VGQGIPSAHSGARDIRRQSGEVELTAPNQAQDVDRGKGRAWERGVGETFSVSEKIPFEIGTPRSRVTSRSPKKARCYRLAD